MSPKRGAGQTFKWLSVIRFNTACRSTAPTVTSDDMNGVATPEWSGRSSILPEEADEYTASSDVIDPLSSGICNGRTGNHAGSTLPAIAKVRSNCAMNGEACT